MGFLKRILGGSGDKKAHAAAAPTRLPQAACPYCGVILDRPPEKTRACPACGEKIVVRTRMSDRVKIYLTEANGRAYDAERKQEAFRNKAIRAATMIGFDREAFERKEKELSARGPGYGPGDAFWALAGERALECAKSGDLHGLSMTYFQQALWLYQEGRSYAHLRLECEKTRAMYYRDRGYQQLKVSADDCDNCKQFDGRIYPIEQAINEWPVPLETCTNGWCSCTWVLA